MSVTTALCAVSSNVKHQYHFVYEPKNLTEARSYCREKYTDLATINNMEEVNILNNMADLSKMVYSENSYGSMNNGQWDDLNCETLFVGICSDVIGQNVTFSFTNRTMTWTQAQSYCRENHTDLASIRNMEENQKVKEMVSTVGGTFWIGLYRDSWKWLDGSNSSFSYLKATDQSETGNEFLSGSEQHCCEGGNVEAVCMSVTTALCAVSSNVKHQYHFVYELKNLTEARSYCREKYTDLATINNMEEVNILNNMANLSKMVYSKNSYTAWIGLYNDVNSWRWSLSDRSFYKDGETEFRQWASGKPNNYQSNEHCTAFYSNGQWDDLNCETLPPLHCGLFSGQNVTFSLTNRTMTWTQAQNYCREHHTDLASIRNMEENQKLDNMFSSGEIFWIGLYRDTWKWLDGSNSSFRYWDAGQPDNVGELCVAVEFGYSGKWGDYNCDLKKAFICYSPPTSKQLIRVRLGMNSSLDLNNTAVKEEMLKQIKQKLKEQGLNEDVKLSWKKQPDGNVFHKEKKKTTLSLDKAEELCPECYKVNSPDEMRLLAIADNFQRQYSHLYPDRKPLLLCPINECGVKKFVSTTLRPTPTIYPELFTWEGCASFVANFLSLDLLEPPVDLPRYLFSPTSVLQTQRATCFEFATLLCSVLLGAHYDAYCVSGYAVKEMCLLDQSLQECPLLDTGGKSVISDQETQDNKYTVKPVTELQSHFLMQQEKKKQDAEAELLRKQKLHEESEQRPADPLRGLRVHCWVLVLSGSRSVQENFFIDPLTGNSYATDDNNFLGIESVWNNLNYYVNMQDCRNGCADMAYDLEDLKMWEPVLSCDTAQPAKSS
ncbi:hypothetical protein L3Q82_016274 [Scortum barcoo]|uniref:Uncharacterized protein n=1 Tax=Scortum barcoo TaxID=214431 RepID=A0ACB8VSL9_9TELE|nr:hypothetical protein L3Q82_016274 [Scortum barcoo]